MKSDKMRKDLQAAHDLAAEHHPLSYYKDVLHQFQEDLIEQEKARAAKAATPKGKKSKSAAAAAEDGDEDEDVEMADAADDDGTTPKEKKVKKRKAEDSAEVPLHHPCRAVHRRMLTLARRPPRDPTRSRSPKSS